MSNLTKRIFTALIGIPIVALVTYLGHWWFVGVVGLLLAGAQYEFYTMAFPKLDWRYAGTGILLGSVILLYQYTGVLLGASSMILFIGLILFGALGKLEESLEEKDRWPRIAWVMIGVFYPTWMFSYLISLRHTWSDVLTRMESFWLVIGLLLIVWVTDSMAYFVGKSIGKTPLAPSISPKKTWEGTLGGFFGAFLVAILLKLTVLSFFSWTNILACAAIGGGLGQVGDLVESKLKRSFQIKDSGNILPGHGGVLDRIDGLILVIPLYYLYLSYFADF